MPTNSIQTAAQGNSDIYKLWFRLYSIYLVNIYGPILCADWQSTLIDIKFNWTPVIVCNNKEE